MNEKSTATERIWEDLSKQLRSFLRLRVSDEQTAEDLLQETFVRIHRKIDDVEDEQRIRSWVFQIARNLIIDHYRGKLPDTTSGVEEIPGEASGDENLNELVAGWLPAMISQLPESYREAVELYELQGISQQEIADRLDLSLSGAKSRVQRGRAKLKTLLDDCCSFEQDRRGNVIDYARNNPNDNGRCGC